MSQQLINLSPDLKRLRDEGFEIEIRNDHLLIAGIPYVNSKKELKRGILVSDLSMSGNKTIKPANHVAHFSGEHPCQNDGAIIPNITCESSSKVIGGLTINYSFSCKPSKGGYEDYYEKVTTYVEIISAHAKSMDDKLTAKTFKTIESSDPDSVFHYFDTNSSRAGISVISDKLKTHKVAIIGLGGTGSYILDLIAKTPVKEIHLFDGDKFFSHNAFRSPGAPSVEELNKAQNKVNYFSDIYSRMRKNIIPHENYINASNVDQLLSMDFIFMSIDKADIKKLIIEKLDQAKLPFIDVGMGIEVVDESLIGILRVTTSTDVKREHVRDNGRIPLSDGANDEYSQNIQIADLNALNATLAVIKWKKICGFYQDLENEHHSTYSINVNQLLSDDQSHKI